MSDLLKLNDMDGAKEKYPQVFSPLEIRGITIPNKIFWPPWALKFADNGQVTDKLIKFYSDLADGGCGLVITGAAMACEDSASLGFERIIRAYSDDYVPGLEKMFTAIKERGSIPGIQLVHGGASVYTPGPGMDAILTPSGISNPVMAQTGPEYKVREMTGEEIKKMIREFIDTAIRCIDAGALFIDVHGGHGYLLAQFLSPLTNKRTDDYGGSPEKRARVTTEIIKGIREAAGDSVIISVRISANEFLSGGLVPEDYQSILPVWEEAGLDIVNASNGHAVLSGDKQVPPKSDGSAPYIAYITKLKDFTSLPVVAVGSILDMATAENLLKEKKADIIAMGRAQFADPALVRKCAQGKEGDIRLCKHDNLCIKAFFELPEIVCAVNPDYKKQ